MQFAWWLRLDDLRVVVVHIADLKLAKALAIMVLYMVRIYYRNIYLRLGWKRIPSITHHKQASMKLANLKD